MCGCISSPTVDYGTFWRLSRNQAACICIDLFIFRVWTFRWIIRRGPQPQLVKAEREQPGASRQAHHPAIPVRQTRCASGMIQLQNVLQPPLVSTARDKSAASWRTLTDNFESQSRQGAVVLEHSSWSSPKNQDRESRESSLNGSSVHVLRQTAKSRFWELVGIEPFDQFLQSYPTNWYPDDLRMAAGGNTISKMREMFPNKEDNIQAL